jgi:hypothetical protein
MTWKEYSYFTVIMIFLTGMLILEIVGPTEIKTISGVKSEGEFGATFYSDGGAHYRISDYSLAQYIFCKNGFTCENHVTVNATLLTTYFDKKIVDVEGYTQPSPYKPPKCSDCGGLFKL